MTRSSGTTVENNFTRGLITEATGLNFPENAVTNCLNVRFKEVGAVCRRLGIDYENGYSVGSETKADYISSYVWETVDKNGNITFVVVQNGRYIYFYEAGENSLSDNKKSFSIDLVSYKTSGTTDTQIKENRCSYSSGNGYLFIAHSRCEPLYVSYDSDTDSITVNQIILRIRDLEGLSVTHDGISLNYRPPDNEVDEEHEYNLQNQGWIAHPVNTGSGLYQPTAYFRALDGNWPSMSDIWWLFKDSTGILNSSTFNNIREGVFKAPKGNNLLDAFNQVRQIFYHGTSSTLKPLGSTITGGFETIDTKTSGGERPSATEFFAGRVWWSGVKYPEFNSKIYFSKIIETDEDFKVCHQVNNPTNESYNELLPTDGGVVNILDIAEIVSLKTIGNSLVIFATNGIWSITGSETQGFTATGYEVSKISEIGVISPSSIISVNGIPFWWSYSGIYTINEDIGKLSVISVTEKTINSFYVDDIDNTSKFYSQGVYNQTENQIMWLYRSLTASSFDDNFEYNKILTLDLDTNAFSVYEINITNISINSVVNIKNRGQEDKNLFLVHNGTGFTFAQFTNTNYLDWYSEDSTGVSYESYFLAGYKLRGNSNRDFQTNYITITSKTDSNTSFLVSGYWDYALTSGTKRVSTKQQGYLHRSNTSYSSRKLKLRGNGKVVQYKIENHGNNPFEISGWATLDSVEEKV